MNKPFRPMKPPQGTLNIDDVRYPVWASIKYDGFRTAIKDGKTVLNSLRELDNLHVRTMLTSCPELEGHDGELVILPLNDNKCFNRCQSAFRARDGQPDFRFVVFDRVVPEKTFEERWVDHICMLDDDHYPDWVIIDAPILLHTRAELDAFVESVLADGHEGVILRAYGSGYKFSRSTFKDQWLLRIKPMETAEGVIVDFECEFANLNEATTNALGRSKRSSAKAGLVAKDTLGKLLVRTKRWGDVWISGFSDDFADEVWRNKEKYRGELATFAYQEIGSLEQPRLAKFKGLRSRSDMS